MLEAVMQTDHTNTDIFAHRKYLLKAIESTGNYSKKEISSMKSFFELGGFKDIHVQISRPMQTLRKSHKSN